MEHLNRCQLMSDVGLEVIPDCLLLGLFAWWDVGKRVRRWGHLKEPRTSVTSTEIINGIKPKSLMLSRDMRHKNQIKRCAHAGDQGEFTRRVRFILDQKMSIAGRIADPRPAPSWWEGAASAFTRCWWITGPPVKWSHNGPGCHTPEHWWHPWPSRPQRHKHFFDWALQNKTAINKIPTL